MTNYDKLTLEVWTDGSIMPDEAVNAASGIMIGYLRLFEIGKGVQTPTVKVPEGVDSAAVRKELLEKYNLEIGAGVKEFASTVWRIGLMGPNAAPDSVALILGALKDVLGK